MTATSDTPGTDEIQHGGTVGSAGEPPGAAEITRPVGTVAKPALLRRIGLDTRPLAVLPYRRMLIGQSAAFVGSMLTATAVAVQMYDITGSSFYVGLVGLAGLIPVVAFGLYGGAIADAVDRRKLYLSSSCVTWAVTLALFAQTLLGLRKPWVILALIFVQAGGFAVSSSTRGAIVPRLVEPVLVPAANALNYTMGNIGQVAGPLLAGALLGLHHGYLYAYGIDAVLFTAALWAGFELPPIPPSGTGTSLGLRSVVEGLAFIARSPMLWMSFLVDICAMVLAMPTALFPAIAEERFGGDVGPLYAAIAVGSVVAGLLGGWIGRVRRQGRALILAVMAWGVAVALAGVGQQLWVVFALLAVAGAADLVSAVLRQTILQTFAPDEMRGRMQGVFVTVVAGGPRLGDARAGGMASLTSPTISWVGGGLACLVVVAGIGVTVRSFWRYETAGGPET
ncbi:MFS transporter [Kineosporia sp. J2-2]|uniref:MFS transporter n=1 Tax=Kineosporia corallincola TaxID=2835133 RepID=A0ABS5TD83_9ACTN|nr:MFS transporter [Kineosporia corallincola]MBT0769015.1 MFS transporter [Kineosporia corallincola]